LEDSLSKQKWLLTSYQVCNVVLRCFVRNRLHLIVLISNHKSSC
jgi:hypothetical protein